MILSFALAPGAWPQSFGQNHVVLRDFKWKVTSTEHFDIHYYEDSAPWVPFAAKVLERSYQQRETQLHSGFKQRRPFFLYANVNDMEQSNIVEVGDGTGGVTEGFKDRFMVYSDGSLEWLDTVISHELTHVFQYNVLLSGFWRSGRILKGIIYPLWFMEGMPEYFTTTQDYTSGETIVRDAATSGGLIPLWKLEHFSHLKPHQIRLAYETGGSAMEFLDTEYGPGKVADMLHMFQSRFDTNGLLQELIGADIFAFDRKWREYLEDKYRRVVRVERLKEPSSYGSLLTGPEGNIPMFNTSPVFTPDGTKMAYVSTRDGYPPDIVLQDLATGRVRRLFSGQSKIENILQGNFVNISRVLAISPDGKMLAFAGQKNHRDSIYLYDLDRHRMEKVPLKGFQAVLEPAFSPDGQKLAFSGMKDAMTDIYLLDLKSRQVRQLTSDPEDDQSPAFSPDGKSIVYSSEVEIPGDTMPYQRRLYRLNLADLTATRISDARGAARDPVYSRDGKRIVFSMEKDGFYEIYELDHTTGRLLRLTRSVGGAQCPVYSPKGDLCFSAFRRGSIHVYCGGRERFLEEEVQESASRAEVQREGAPERTAARSYEPSYSTDLFLPAFFYSSSGGIFWTSYWQGSDMLGNHEAQALLSYGSGNGYLNYQTVYSYARLRPLLSAGVVGFNVKGNYDSSSGDTIDESAHTQFVSAAYPLDRYHRLDLSARSVTDRIYDQSTNSVTEREARIASADFIRDTVRGRYLVATRGSRLRLSYLTSPHVLGGNFNYHGYSIEGHQYVPAGDMSALALRVLGVENVGPSTPQEILGGIGGVRGYARSSVDNVGSRLAIATAEMRFPIMSNLDYYMWYIFPDFYFKAITAALFTDAGYVWDTNDQIHHAQINGIRQSYGISLRVHTFILQLFPLVIHFDYARRTTSDGGIFYVYIGIPGSTTY